MKIRKQPECVVIAAILLMFNCSNGEPPSKTGYNSFIFKSAEGEAAYTSAYEKSMSLWTVPYEAGFVKTRFGNRGSSDFRIGAVK